MVERDMARVVGQVAWTRPVRRPRGLHDLALVPTADGGLADASHPDHPLTATELVRLVRRADAQDHDLRALIVADEGHLPVLRAVAQHLGRDILVAPAGSRLIHRPVGPSTPERPADGESTDDGQTEYGPSEDEDEVIPVDATTGNAVDWQTIQPGGAPGVAFTWFELADGLVRERTGLVAIPLPDGGRMLTTRSEFVAARSAAAMLRPGHRGLVTVGVGIEAGDFKLGYFDSRTVLTDGAGLAAALRTLGLRLDNLRAWLTWPDTQAERRRLRHNLAELAAATGATVWAPGEPGAAVVLDGCLDLSALDHDGASGRWEAFGPDAPFESDVDGRLVPAGGVEASAMAGPVAIAPTILPDGRLAVRYRDDSLLAVGGRQLVALLRDTGWVGGAVRLRASMAADQAPGTGAHLAYLATYAGAPVTLHEPTTEPTAAPVTLHEPTAAPPAVADLVAPVPPAFVPRGGQPGPGPAGPPSVPEIARRSGRHAAPDAAGYAWSEVNRAFQQLDPSEPDEAARLTELARLVADYLVADRDLANAPANQRTARQAAVELLGQRIERLLDGPRGAPLTGAPAPGSGGRS